LDEEGKKVPTMRFAAVRVPIATGNIGPFDSTFVDIQKLCKLREVHNIANYIAKDDFLTALIEQINVDDQNQIVLIPKMGKLRIRVGDDSILDEKFTNLKIMYKKGMPSEGWDKFTELNIQYKGQVVTTVKENNL
jgi:cell division protein FtsQ